MARIEISHWPAEPACVTVSKPHKEKATGHGQGRDATPDRHRHLGEGPPEDRGRTLAPARGQLRALSQDAQLPLEREGPDVPDAARDVRGAVQRAVDRA